MPYTESEITIGLKKGKKLHTSQPSIIYSMFDPMYLARCIEDVYKLHRVRCQLIKATVRDTYHVWGNDQQFIFYVYRHQPRSKPEIKAELAWIQYLHQQGLPTAKPIPTRHGDYAVSLDAPEGTRQAVLFEFVLGQVLSKKPALQTAFRTGQLVAQLHDIQMPKKLERPLLDFQPLVRESLLAFMDAAPHRQADIDYLHRAAEALEKALHETRMEKQLIHGDIIPSNILINDQGVPLLIDFDSCGYGWTLYDVATFLVEADYWSMGQDVRSAFLEGYNSSNILTEEDQKVLHILQGVRLIWSLGIPASYVNTWGKVYFSDAIIDKQMEMLKRLMKPMS